MPNDSGILAVKKFLDDQNNIDKVKSDSKWTDCQKIKGCNLTFRLQGQPELICQSKAIQNHLKNQLETPSETEETLEAIRLVTAVNNYPLHVCISLLVALMQSLLLLLLSI